MRYRISSVGDIGVLARTVRKTADMRIDDLAATAKLSKQFVSDVELGKPTVQLGRVLQMLDELGVRVYLDVPKEVEPHLAQHRAQIEKVSNRRKSRSATRSE